MNENDFARRVIGILNRQLEKLPEETETTLARARQAALKSAPEKIRARDLFAEWVASHRLMLRMALPVFFLVVAVASAILMQDNHTQDPFDVDTALIGDELPIHAYTDPGFDTWLRHSSHEESQ